MMVPQPVLAVFLLFPVTDEIEAAAKAGMSSSAPTVLCMPATPVQQHPDSRAVCTVHTTTQYAPRTCSVLLLHNTQACCLFVLAHTCNSIRHARGVWLVLQAMLSCSSQAQPSAPRCTT
jgi:hypothetical protein